MDPSALPASQGRTPLDLAEVFAFLIVMLGPLKLLGPFALATQALSKPERRRLALEATAVSTIAVLAGGFVGRELLVKWHVSLPALMLGAGLVFLLVALRLVLNQYEPQAPPPSGPPTKPNGLRFAFPHVVTPYGIAAVIIFMTTGDSRRTLGLIVLIVAIMLLNLLAMLFVRPILRTLGLPLQVLAAVLGVVQIALAVQIILTALRAANVIAAPAP